MLYGFLVFLFSLLSIFIILVILFQKGQGNLFTGRFGSETSAVLGGSQGNDILQKITWICGLIFMFSAFFLTLYNSKRLNESKYLKEHMVKEEKVKKETPKKNNQEKLEEEILNKQVNENNREQDTKEATEKITSEESSKGSEE